MQMAGRSVLVFSSCYNQGGFAFQIQVMKQTRRFGLVKCGTLQAVSYCFAFVIIVVSVSLSQHKRSVKFILPVAARSEFFTPVDR